MVKVNITDYGKALLVKALHNEAPINFVSMKFGNGDAPDDYSELTDLMNPLLECGISAMEKGDNYIQLTSVFDNNDVEADFDMTEIGVFAEDADDGKGMFAYVNQAEESEPVYSSASNKLKENTVSVQIIVDDVENVTATIKSLANVTRADFEDHIHNYNNPHKVTKEQVGLGNVENTTVGNAKVEFKAADPMANIESGETVSTVFGKIYTAFKALLAHLADYNNPHKVTPVDIKAAAVGHTHSATDIKSGILGVARGGTGKGTWTSGLLLFASKTSELSQVSRPTSDAVLMQGAEGEPQFKSFSDLEFCGKSADPPENKNVFWIDPDPITGGLKYHNGTEWVHVPVAYSE